MLPATINQNNYILRPAQATDIAFIYSTWLNSYRTDSDLGKSCKKSVFFNEYKEVIDNILSNSGTEILVAALPNDESVILGYLVYQATPSICIHYCFIKESFRRFGIAKELVNSLPKQNSYVISHKTYTLNHIIQQNQVFTYNPFILYKKSPELSGDIQGEQSNG